MARAAIQRGGNPPDGPARGGSCGLLSGSILITLLANLAPDPLIISSLSRSRTRTVARFSCSRRAGWIVDRHLGRPCDLDLALFVVARDEASELKGREKQGGGQQG